jgi:hypothetical protein
VLRHGKIADGHDYGERRGDCRHHGERSATTILFRSLLVERIIRRRIRRAFVSRSPRRRPVDDLLLP